MNFTICYAWYISLEPVYKYSEFPTLSCALAASHALNPARRDPSLVPRERAPAPVPQHVLCVLPPPPKVVVVKEAV